MVSLFPSLTPSLSQWRVQDVLTSPLPSIITPFPFLLLYLLPLFFPGYLPSICLSPLCSQFPFSISLSLLPTSSLFPSTLPLHFLFSPLLTSIFPLYSLLKFITVLLSPSPLSPAQTPNLSYARPIPPLRALYQHERDWCGSISITSAVPTLPPCLPLWSWLKSYYGSEPDGFSLFSIVIMAGLLFFTTTRLNASGGLVAV